MKSGIYQITNSANGHSYIGSALDMRARWLSHQQCLARGRHHNRRLQNAWNRYGAEALTFAPLLICSPQQLIFFEQRAIDALAPEYNYLRVAANSFGWRHSEESKALVSQALRGNKHGLGKKKPEAAIAKSVAFHTGRKRPAETCALIAAKAQGRKRTAESIEKGAAKRRGVHLSPEHRATLLGNKRALGYRHTDEWKAAASAQRTGIKRPKSPEPRAKISAALKGRPHTAEQSANQSAAQLGKKRGPYKLKGRAP